MPVVGFNRGLGESFVRENPMDGELRKVEGCGAGRVAGEEIRQEVPPLVLCPARPRNMGAFGVSFDPLEGAVWCSIAYTVPE